MQLKTNYCFNSFLGKDKRSKNAKRLTFFLQFLAETTYLVFSTATYFTTRLSSTRLVSLLLLCTKDRKELRNNQELCSISLVTPFPDGSTIHLFLANNCHFFDRGSQFLFFLLLRYFLIDYVMLTQLYREQQLLRRMHFLRTYFLW